VPDQRAELDVAGVGVRVEVDHRYPAVADVLGHARGVRPGDGVVAAEDQRHCARRGYGVHRLIAPVLPYRTAWDKPGRGRQLLEEVGLGGRERSLPRGCQAANSSGWPSPAP